MQYLHDAQRRAFVLENVKGFTTCKTGTKDTTTWEHLYEQLKKRVPTHNIYNKLLNTRDHGLPQNRERLYIVGIHKKHDNAIFVWPDPVTSWIPIDHLLEPASGAKSSMPSKQGTVAFNMVEHHLEKLKKKNIGGHQFKQTWIIDC
ncbi:MAG: DNA cytosine methyltransferase, partial [Planctomycetaceae bacterium]